MSEANNWKWISSPPDYVRNLVEELRVKGEEGAAEMFKNYVEELHFKCAENVMLEAKYDFLYIENKRLKASLEFAADAIEALRAERDRLRAALDKAGLFIAKEYATHNGEWLAPQARPIYAAICEALGEDKE